MNLNDEDNLSLPGPDGPGKPCANPSYAELTRQLRRQYERLAVDLGNCGVDIISTNPSRGNSPGEHLFCHLSYDLVESMDQASVTFTHRRTLPALLGIGSSLVMNMQALATILDDQYELANGEVRALHRISEGLGDLLSQFSHLLGTEYTFVQQTRSSIPGGTNE